MGRATVPRRLRQEDTRFARLVSLACHDLGTPLATVHGFARVLLSGGALGSTETRYTEVIEAASAQIAELVESLSLVARIEGDRYQPTLRPSNTLTLARAVRDRLGHERVAVTGQGGAVAVDPGATEAAVAALADCAHRHGGVGRVAVEAGDPELRLRPIPGHATPIILAEELRDFGAAVARAHVEALGGWLELAGEALVVRLPHHT
ncbi:MAG: hypothetical protein M3322_04990 [Actinomycetota bacterium]|nr:hypothetical protein [Actinomycetota bacterium]